MGENKNKNNERWPGLTFNFNLCLCSRLQSVHRGDCCLVYLGKFCKNKKQLMSTPCMGLCEASQKKGREAIGSKQNGLHMGVNFVVTVWSGYVTFVFIKRKD